MNTPSPQDSSGPSQSDSLEAYLPLEVPPSHPGELQPGAADDIANDYAAAHYAAANYAAANYAATPVARPKTVDYAFFVWLTGIGLEIISSLVSMLYLDVYVNEALAGDEQVSISSEDARAIAALAIITLVAIFCFTYFLFFYVVFKMRSGAGWARILLTIGVIMNLCCLPFAIYSEPVLLLAVSTALACLVEIVGLVFAWSKDSNAYFVTVKQARV